MLLGGGVDVVRVRDVGVVHDGVNTKDLVHSNAASDTVADWAGTG
jgi:hypothetical protein